MLLAELPLQLLRAYRLSKVFLRCIVPSSYFSGPQEPSLGLLLLLLTDRRYWTALLTALASCTLF